MSLRTGGREAVEDTETIHETPFDAIYAGVWGSIELDDETIETMTGDVLSSISSSGFVIVRAEDALTAEDRAAIGFVIRCLKEVCCDVESPHYLNEEGAEIARRVEAIADGGQA